MSHSSNDLIKAAAEHADRINRHDGFKNPHECESVRFFSSLLLNREMSAYAVALMMYELGKHSGNSGLNFSIAAHLYAGAYPALKHAQGSIREEISRAIESGALIANAMTESGSGSDSFNMKSTAVRQGNSFLLNGSKSFVTNGPVADYYLLYALTDAAKGFFGGISCFLIDAKKHAIKTGAPASKTALRNSPMCELYFNDVIIGEEYLIGKEGAGAMIFMESMNQERAGIAALHAGAMSRICESVSRYVKERIKGTGTLSDLQGVQFRIAEIAMLTETSRLMSMNAARALDSGDGTIQAAKAKVHVSENYVTIAKNTAELMGGYGIMQNSPYSDLLNDAQASLIYSGPNDVLRNLIAANL